MADLEFIYNVSLNKLHNFQITRRDSSDSLRKLVLLNNFVFKKFVSPEQEEQIEEPLEWSEEDIKKDEESWLDSCLNDLDEEDEDGYIYVNKPSQYQPTTVSIPMDRYQYYNDYYNNEMEYEQRSYEQQISDDKVTDDVIIPHDLLHHPFFEPGESKTFNMITEEEQNDDNCTLQQEDLYDTNMTENENLTCENFHPYWKDNSIISQSTSPLRPYFNLNTRSFGIPKIFHKYRLGQDDSAPPFILELLHPNQSLEFPHYQSSLKRSKDDLDILYSLAPRDLDKGALMDMISMLEYYGKANHDTKNSNSSEINDIWFVGNND